MEPEKGAKEPSVAVQADTGGPTQSYNEELSGEIDFFVRHIGGPQLSEENASKLKEQAEAIDYSPRTMVFGGGRCFSMCA